MSDRWEDSGLIWVNPLDMVPEQYDIVEIIDDDGFKTIGQYHRGIAIHEPDGTVIEGKPPRFEWIFPEDVGRKTYVVAWRKLI